MENDPVFISSSSEMVEAVGTRGQERPPLAYASSSKMRERKEKGYVKDSIRLQSPYFVPDASIQESLKMAAQSGVDVKVIIPCKPDHVFVYWATAH